MEKRDFKTHPQQWSTIVDFGEEHPTIFRPQFQHGDGDARQNAELWEKLAETLNSMGFGFRSVDKWKMAVGRWKSKTKSKAAQLRIEAEKTGGGPSNAVPLTETEERLMKLMGWKSVTGDENVELGMARPIRPISTHLPLPQPQPLRDREKRLPLPEPQLSDSAEIEESAFTSKSPPPLISFSGIARKAPLTILTSSSGSARKCSLPPPEPQSFDRTETEGSAYSSKSHPPLVSSSEPAKKRSRLSTEKSRKFVSLSKMHQEAMEERKKLREIVRRQAEAQEATVQILQDLFAYYKMKDNI